MNFLITGATGFIGRHLSKHLVDEGNSVTAIVRPESDSSQLDKNIYTYEYKGDVSELTSFLKNGQYDGVIHLAAHCPTSHRGDDIVNLMNANLVFGTEVLEAASQSGIKWFINTGSYMQHYDDKEYSPSILYAATKQAFLDITRYWTEMNRINIVTLELFDNFGKDDTRKKVLNLWRDALKTGETISLSPGHQIIDVSPVENVVEAFKHLSLLLQQDIELKMNGSVFSLQSQNRMTLRELAELFQKIAKRPLNIEWGGRPYRNREIMNPWTKGRQIPGYKPTISLEEAIKKYLDVE